MLLVTAEEAHQMDHWACRHAGIPLFMLMDHAGRRVAEEIKSRFQPESSIVVVAGTGNNGGDAIVCARYLLQWGYQVTLLMAGTESKRSQDSKRHLQAYRSWNGLVQQCEELDEQRMEGLFASAQLLVDGLLGTGLRGAPHEEYRGLIQLMNESQVPILAIDLPSGLLADQGEIPGDVIQATWTVTFEAYKWCHLLSPATSKVGKVIVASIGIPPRAAVELGLKNQVLTTAMIASLLPVRENESHKGSYGHLCIIGGSQWMPGAPQYAMEAAYRMGAGLVTLGLPYSLAQGLATQVRLPLLWPWEEEESHFATTSSAQQDFDPYTALAIGPGIGVWNGGERWLEQLLNRSHQPVVIDADALKLLARHPQMLTQHGERIILTPHPGEMAVLCNVKNEEVRQHRRELAIELATKWGVHVVLKGFHTLIATPDGTVYCNPTGNAALAKGGTGDILTGMIAALLAQGVALCDAARVGTYLHGLIADLYTGDPYSLLPADVITHIPRVLQHVLTIRSTSA